MRCRRGGGARTFVSLEYLGCVHAGFSAAETQRTVFMIFEAHETCIFFFLNLNGEKFLRLVVHGPVEY